MVTKRTGIVKDGVRPCFLRGGHMKKGLGTGIRSGLLGLVAICALGANAFSVKAEAEKIDTITLQVFYENGCRSCNVQKELQEIIDEKTGAYKDEIPCEVTFYNMFKTEERELGAKVLQENEMEEDGLNYPVILVNGYVLEGEEEINELLPAAYQAVGEAEAVYFYREDCDECNRVKLFMESLPETINCDGTESGFHMISLNSREGDNGKLIRKMFEKYNVPEEDQMVPFVFLADSYLAGEDAIREKLETELSDGAGLNLKIK